MNGNLVNTVNSVHRRSYTAGDLRFASRRMCGRPRLRAGVGKAPTWLPCASGRSLRPKRRRSSPFPFLCFPGAVAIAPLSFCRRTSARAIAAKRVPAPLVPCASSKPVLVACLHRKLAVRALLPRGRQRPRRECFAVASVLR